MEIQRTQEGALHAAASEVQRMERGRQGRTRLVGQQMAACTLQRVARGRQARISVAVEALARIGPQTSRLTPKAHLKTLFVSAVHCN